MVAHLRYLSYVVRHKWFVLLAGLKVRASLWRLLVHDLSKFRPSEWSAYVDYFYRGGVGLEAFDRAWNHHQNRNPHHWQYWMLQKDDGGMFLLPMPEGYVREMVADWAGAGRAITGRWEVATWYTKNAERMCLCLKTEEAVKRLLDQHFPTESDD